MGYIRNKCGEQDIGLKDNKKLQYGKLKYQLKPK